LSARFLPVRARFYQSFKLETQDSITLLVCERRAAIKARWVISPHISGVSRGCDGWCQRETIADVDRIRLTGVVPVNTP
jgi:hypothetical protein